MIYVVRIQAAGTAAFNNITTQLSNASDGFITLVEENREGCYLIAHGANAAQLRNWLRTLGATGIVIIRARGEWAAWADGPTTEWLQGAAGLF